MESDNKLIIRQRSSRITKSNYLDDNNNDCLTDAFISIFKNSRWCIESIYELFFKSLWHVLLLTKEDYDQNHHKTINSIDIMSINNSASKNDSKNTYPRHRLPKSNSQYSRQKSSSKINMLSNKTRVTVRSISNLNLNRAESNHTPLTDQINPSNTLGTINSHITVVPVHSSHCQNMRTSKHDLPTNPIDIKQSENINLREQLADTLCRRSYEPLTYMNRGMCCGHCRPVFFPNVPFHHSGHYVPPTIPQPQLNKERELSQKSIKMGDASETQSTPYSGSPSIQSHLTNSPEENEPLSTGTIFNKETSEQNPSILSFPDHDTPLSQHSEELTNDDSQLRLDTQVLVDDSIQNAQEKYQRILRMSIDQDPQHNAQDTVKQTIENQSKSVFISDKANKQNLPHDKTLCQELCNKLNLSDSNQINEIVRILASNAPHILKEQSPNNIPLINTSNTNKENENTLCSQLLLHPPFKPKRLIHLCADGTIQILSAVDDNSNENQLINQQQYHLNYSNSAISPSIQQNHILTKESSLALEYETTTVDVKTNCNHKMCTGSTSTQQSHLVSLQQKNTLFKYDIPLGHTLTLEKDVELSSDHLKTVCQADDPIVKIKLDLNDETIEVNSEDDENSLPEIFFKRIIAPESSITSVTGISNQSMKYEKDETFYVRRKNHSKSRHNRSRSSTNKKSINIGR